MEGPWRRAEKGGRRLPPAAALRCGAHTGSAGCYSGWRSPLQEGPVPALPRPFPRLLLTLTSDVGSRGTLRSRPGGSWGPGLRGTCPPGPRRGRAGRAACCSGKRPAPGVIGGASRGCLLWPLRAASDRRVTPAAPDLLAGTAGAPSPPPPAPSGLGRCGGCAHPESVRQPPESRSAPAPSRTGPGSGSTCTRTRVSPPHPPVPSLAI